MSPPTLARVPTQLIDVWRLPGGERITLRPVLPQDAELEQALVRGLSPVSRYQRFFAPIRELPPSWLERMTRIDYERHLAVIAETWIDGRAHPVGEARYVVDDGDPCAAEFAVLVGEGWRRRGIARRLIDAIGGHAAAEGLQRLHGETLADNAAMIRLALELGFRARPLPGDARLVKLERQLRPDPPQPCARAAHAPSAALPAY